MEGENEETPFPLLPFSLPFFPPSFCFLFFLSLLCTSVRKERIFPVWGHPLSLNPFSPLFPLVTAVKMNDDVDRVHFPFSSFSPLFSHIFFSSFPFWCRPGHRARKREGEGGQRRHDFSPFLLLFFLSFLFPLFLPLHFSPDARNRDKTKVTRGSHYPSPLSFFSPLLPLPRCSPPLFFLFPR